MSESPGNVFVVVMLDREQTFRWPTCISSPEESSFSGAMASVGAVLEDE